MQTLDTIQPDQRKLMRTCAKQDIIDLLFATLKKFEQEYRNMLYFNDKKFKLDQVYTL